MRIVCAARRAGEALLSLVFPPHCAKCGLETAPGIHLCGRCAETARKIEAPFCQQCSEPFHGAITDTFTCENCRGRQLHFDCAVARYLSRGVVREFIHRFKYDGHIHLRHPLAAWAADALADDRLRAPGIDAFVPVPLHRVRFRERDFNQAEEIALLLSRRTGIPVAHGLDRIRYTTTQTRLDRNERMENLRNAFRVRRPDGIAGRHLVLVDDIFTTGSTVDECARVLKKAGAASVRVVTVARG